MTNDERPTTFREPRPAAAVEHAGIEPASAFEVHSPEQAHTLPGGGGDSKEQRNAERYILDALGERLGVVLEPRSLYHSSGAKVEVDGADADLTVLVECWAHQGAAKGGHKLKLMNEALKLHWIASTLPHRPRVILGVTDEAAVEHLRGNSWQGQALRDLGVELEVVEVLEGIRAGVVRAQERPYR
ncbi:hypothetical protein [Pengzhenrongella sp.]|uniref:hypothetical protein n=1 Tax=Pengzhenrongella sp. TaxID=2888820 RepID=UPI002F952231